MKTKFQQDLENNVKVNEINVSEIEHYCPQTTSNTTFQTPKTPLMTSTPFIKKANQKYLSSKFDENTNESSNSTPSSSYNRMPLKPRNDYNEIVQRFLDEADTQIDEQLNDLCVEAEMKENIRMARVKELERQIGKISQGPSIFDPAFSYGKLYVMKQEKNRLKLRHYHPSSKIKLKESMTNKLIPYDEMTQHLFNMSSYTDDPHQEIFVTIADNTKLVLSSKNSGMVGYNEIKHSFLSINGIRTRQLPDAWVQNAYEMSFWKLNFMENFLEKIDENMALNPENILLQMKYRYDREIHRFETPPLRKIVEKEVPPAKRIVLKVVKITYTTQHGYELELSDGWYKLKTLVDSCLAEAITKSKIQVHSKLLICNMELKQTPAEANIFLMVAASTLKIFGNSTRLVDWDTKLGFCKNPLPYRITLDSVKNTGGLIGKLRVVITHVYSPIYCETVDDKRGKSNLKIFII